MALIKYNKKNFATRKKRDIRPTISINQTSGLMSLNAPTLQMLGVDINELRAWPPGDSDNKPGIIFLQDDENPDDYFIALSSDPEAFKLRANKKINIAHLNSSHAARRIVQGTKASEIENVKFYVGQSDIKRDEAGTESDPLVIFTVKPIVSKKDAPKLK